MFLFSRSLNKMLRIKRMLKIFRRSYLCLVVYDWTRSRPIRLRAILLERSEVRLETFCELQNASNRTLCIGLKKQQQTILYLIFFLYHIHIRYHLDNVHLFIKKTSKLKFRSFHYINVYKKLDRLFKWRIKTMNNIGLLNLT